MAVQLQIPYETLLGLVEQLPSEQQAALIWYLQQRQEHSVEEKMNLLRSAQIHEKVQEEPSPRREDWYEDDES